MSTIVVKNFPDDMHERLKERAERNHRSMTKEVVHLIAAGLEQEDLAAELRHPLSPLAVGRSTSATLQQTPAAAPDGRAALRAALVKQPDGSYVNVLGIEDTGFFDTLERIRAEAKAPDLSKLFDDAS